MPKIYSLEALNNQKVSRFRCARLGNWQSSKKKHVFIKPCALCMSTTVLCACQPQCFAPSSLQDSQWGHSIGRDSSATATYSRGTTCPRILCSVCLLAITCSLLAEQHTQCDFSVMRTETSKDPTFLVAPLTRPFPILCYRIKKDRCI